MTLIINGDLRTDPNQGGVEYVEASGATAGQLLTANGAGGASFQTSAAINLLSTITGIDGKITGQTTLYTVPVGKQLVITDIIKRAIVVTNYTVAMDYGVGITPSFNESVASDQLSTSIITGQNDSTLRAGQGVNLAKTYSAGDVIKFDITTGGTATTLTLAVDLFGYLLDA